MLYIHWSYCVDKFRELANDRPGLVLESFYPPEDGLLSVVKVFSIPQPDVRRESVGPSTIPTYLLIIIPSGTSRTITIFGAPIFSWQSLACERLAGNPSSRNPGAVGCFIIASATSSTTSSWPIVRLLTDWCHETHVWSKLPRGDCLEQSDPPLCPCQDLGPQQVPSA